MNPTIFTFGDPGLVQEALLALATIFNQSQWWDPASGFGLGGNFLAAALIGLLGIALAAINTQKLRIDYLLTAFILFGITFGVKTDVNIEDVQTGSVAIVSDVPVGVAFVAAAASGAAYDLTQTLSTALQRPGSTTTTLTATGFLQPLRTLLALRGLDTSAQDALLHQSMLDYYRYCVGTTLLQPGNTFVMSEFVSAANPVAYLFDTSRVENWATINYTTADPQGVATTCHAAATDIRARFNQLVTAGVGPVDYLRQKVGADRFNTDFERPDIETAVDVLTRNGATASDWMAAQFLRNLHSEGEAARTMQFNSSQAQHAATLTQAMEEQRSEAAGTGSVFLQMMFPLMTFFQMLFFVLAPLIAFMMIAAPVASLRTLGLYLLLGVWAYSWLPVAAVINHYIQIATQNDLVWGGGLYTSLSGVDPFYDLLATKLTIGANALAATPVIMATLLTGSAMGIANLAGRLSSGGRVDTGITSPGLLSNGPLVSRAPMVTASGGLRAAAGASFLGVPESVIANSGGGSYGVSLQSSVTGASQRVETASQELMSARSSVASAGADIARSASRDESVSASVESAVQRAAAATYATSKGAADRTGITAEDAKSIWGQGSIGGGAFPLGAGVRAGREVGIAASKSAVDEFKASTQDQFNARLAQELEKETGLNASLVARFSEGVQKSLTAGTKLAEATQQSDSAQQMRSSAQQVGADLSWKNAEVAQDLARLNPGAARDATSESMRIRSYLANNGGQDAAAAFDREMARERQAVRGLGLDGGGLPPFVGETVAALRAVQNLADDFPAAVGALGATLQRSGRAVPTMDAQRMDMAGVGAKAEGTGFRDEVRAGMARDGAAVEDASRAAKSKADGIAATVQSGIDNTNVARAGEENAEMARAEQASALARGQESVRNVAEARQQARDAMADPLRKAVDVVADTPGFLGSFDPEAIAAIPADQSAEAAKQANAVVSKLDGDVLGRGPSQGAPSEVFKGLSGLGLDYRTATVGAFLAADRREPGAAEWGLYGGALGGAAGWGADQTPGAAAARSAMATGAATTGQRMLGALRLSGVGAVLGGLAGGITYRELQQDDAEAIRGGLRSQFVDGIRAQYGDAKAEQVRGALSTLGTRPGASLVDEVGAIVQGQTPPDYLEAGRSVGGGTSGGGPGPNAPSSSVGVSESERYLNLGMQDAVSRTTMGPGEGSSDLGSKR
jgi:hypothetical protein